MTRHQFGEVTAIHDISADLDVFELAAVGMVVTNRNGIFQRVNPAFGVLLGRGPGELVGRSFSSLTSPDDVTLSRAVMGNLINKVVATARFEKRYLRPDGSLVWVDMRIRSLTDDDGEVVGFLTQGVDITERKLAEAAANSHLHGLAEAQRLASLGSFEQDPVTGAINPSDELRRMLGLWPGERTDTARVLAAVHPDDRCRLSAAIERSILEQHPVDVVHRLLLGDGTLRWVHSRGWTADPRDPRSRGVGTMLDITARKLAQDALQHAAFHDPLTGLANRALFLDRASHALQRGEREGTPIAVVFVDLDDFKTVNDSFGHQAGDELLSQVAQRLSGIARAGDTVARFGGDEFAVLLEAGEMPKAAEDVATRLTHELEAPFHVSGAEVTLGVSIGIAIGQPGTDTGEDLLRDADQAMYRAKRAGKGRFEIADPAMRDEALNHLTLVNELRRALADDELEVFYQPIVRTPDNSPAAVEALVRWRHPVRGLLAPAEFVGLAESTGLIVPLGDWVLRTACRQVQAWRSAGIVDDSFYVSVNLSARQLSEEPIVDDVATALRESGLPAHALVLEITESTLMLDFDAGLACLHRLKDLGVRLALDDYGTGYSSLNRLGKLPVDIVKIDKSFIDQLTGNREGKALVQSVIDVTEALGMKSVAEGVEHAIQHGALNEMGCGFIQGFLFAQPMPAAETELALARLRSDSAEVLAREAL